MEASGVFEPKAVPYRKSIATSRRMVALLAPSW